MRNRTESRSIVCLVVVIALATFFCGMGSAQEQCDWEEIQKLNASDGDQSDSFGFSVSIDGDVMVVGARGDDDNGDDSGSAYVFRYDGCDWIEEAKLLASDGADDDHFGQSVSIDGDAIVVGAYRHDDNGSWSGSAYVFRYDGSDWIEEAKLLASDGAPVDYFGFSVSIDGDAIVVGTYHDDDIGNGSGSAYVFRYDGSHWTEETKLLASDGVSYDYFGWSVSVSNDVIVVGAYGDDGDNDIDSWAGAAYVFRYDGFDWIEEDKLSASDGDSEDRLGWSVSIDGDAMVVGAPYDEDNGNFSGSAYVFRYNGYGWNEEAKLLAFDGDSDDRFGYFLSIDDDTSVGGSIVIVVGAPYDEDNGEDSGSAYVFRNDGGYGWTEEAKLLSSDGAEQDYFGFSVSIDGDAIVGGADGDDDNGDDSGSAYVFKLTQCVPTLSISPDPLIAGQNALFTGTNLNPNAQTYLAYSLRGLGSTYIPPLNVTLYLHLPAQAGNTITSDDNGTAEWVLHIPNAGAGREVWFQACQYELTTNVVETMID